MEEKKKTYEKPEVEVIVISNDDIVTASTESEVEWWG